MCFLSFPPAEVWLQSVQTSFCILRCSEFSFYKELWIFQVVALHFALPEAAEFLGALGNKDFTTCWAREFRALCASCSLHGSWVDRGLVKLWCGVLLTFVSHKGSLIYGASMVSSCILSFGRSSEEELLQMDYWFHSIWSGKCTLWDKLLIKRTCFYFSESCYDIYRCHSSVQNMYQKLTTFIMICFSLGTW
jgi:hypothetical protein